MANLQERRNKDGKLISYSIRIFRGRGPDGKQLKPFTATFEVKPTWSEKSARKKAEAYAATLEKEVKEGRLENARQRFDQYCDYVLELKNDQEQSRQLSKDIVTSFPVHIRPSVIFC